MSVAAVGMCRDEGDIAEVFLRHASAQVDRVYVLENGSSDGTREILHELARELPVIVQDDPETAYYQSRKTTALAQRALGDGFSWVVPMDFDEVWYVEQDTQQRMSEYLAGLAPDIQVVSGKILNHIPTALDDHSEADPTRRIVWRKRQPAPAPKVCCRLHPSLVIEQGNHLARYGAHGAARVLTVPGLALRHFSWRSAAQYARKIVNGRAAYAATRLPDDIGVHWRMWEGASGDEIEEHFREWFWSDDPENDDELVLDPAPVLG